MGDLKDPRWMYLKAILFLLIIILCAGTLWMQNPQWQTALLTVLMISSCSWGPSSMWVHLIRGSGTWRNDCRRPDPVLRGSP